MVPSATVDVKVISFADLRVSPDKAAYCKGDKASLSIKVAATDNYDISWQRDGAVVPDFANQAEIMTDIPGNYLAVVSSKAKPTCIKSSPIYSLVFHEPPIAKIAKTILTSLCDGEAVGLSVDNNGGTVLWSTGETTASIVVRHSGKYSVRVTSASGCTSEDNIDVLMQPNPVLDVPDTSVCTFTKSTVELTAPAGFAKYFWNGVEGSSTFSISVPQTVTLKVEDTNGCTATQNIIVGSNCPEVQMGNTFTPNNDGVNDTWTISGIGNDATVHLNIYNRNGQEVYKSLGYYIPWDGRYHGKLLPSAVYYYVLSARKGKQKLSGWVTILY
ncbi:gliding motility-associated C-terminal domain-containing protein [Mucilaginibacter psychrotolerans]|uniref:Gliding motility-associated C-terminal domain-containing protein n=1 Tax=Mucilaginibacter psychrotolerans TaxID=1524096 RepID=A0A4Y8SAU6_9SPHI|nr:gliding motility-associated C-terminal domain-containing protein [Mucilaginibacter psychrotolerans]TFF36203.1 gliding motility-associated C-terminal domain-containing protein [Mucilaginibacter psychrotolerans]